MANSAGANLVQAINLGLSIAIVVYTVRIYNATKGDKNPIEIYEENHPNSFSVLSQNSASFNDYSQISKYCQCGKEILNNICTEEQIISGCYDITPNDQKNVLRNLADPSFCNEIIEEKRTKKFSEIFILNYGHVNKTALGILIIYCIILGIIALLILALISLCIYKDRALCFIRACVTVIFYLVLGAGIADIVLFIIMLVKFYKGRTTGDFIEFIEDCDYSDKASYASVVNELKTLKGYMTAFVVLNSIGVFFNYLGAFLNKKPSEDEEE